jgi:hypothetical protein
VGDKVEGGSWVSPGNPLVIFQNSPELSRFLPRLKVVSSYRAVFDKGALKQITKGSALLTQPKGGPLVRPPLPF